MDLTKFESDNRDAKQETSNDNYPISMVANNEWKSFAMYTVEARAIPNMIDGLKPVHRFYLYSSIKNSKKEFKKVSAISGIISEYGYNHGESSAAGAGQLMAAEWNNNIRLIEGRGSFGTRLIQEAGAPRYVYTRLHENFNKYIKDIELSPVHEDPEHEPPKFYLPTIPLVLTIGMKGIATGFATNILPRDPESIIESCKEYVKTGKIAKRLKIKFPDFEGNVEYNSVENKYYVMGIYQRKGKQGLSITEVPYGFDRESYVKVLNTLEDNGEIISYEDLCDKNGFRFEVKLKTQTSAKWSDKKLMAKFKLEKPLTENLTVIGPDGKLVEFDDARDLVASFCDYRLGILQKRIDLRISDCEEKLRWLNVKMNFIQAVLDEKIIFKNKKKADVLKQISGELLQHNHEYFKEDGDRLLRINIMSLTDEMVKDLAKEIKESKKDLTFWKKTTPNDQFVSDIESI